MMPAPELVVLADGTTMEKSSVHTADTPLHHGFSCWIVRENQVLLTRRSLQKLTWPGVWTNAFCGHPGPGESAADAVRRRGQFELGIADLNPELVLPDFRYRAVDTSGFVENELCPVFVAYYDGELLPRPDEVDTFEWVEISSLITAVDSTPFAFSPWLVDELAQIDLREYLMKLT